MSKKGRLIVISAPSGTGKGTVIGEMLKLRPELSVSVSATTREPRPGEAHGRHYFFVTREKFDEMIANDEFLEHETYAGNSYGTPIAPIQARIADGLDTILEIEVKGARSVWRRMDDVISIFISPPSLEELRRRLIGRGTNDEAEIERRLAIAREEILAVDEFQFHVVNDVAERAAHEVLAILDFNREDYIR